MFTEKDNQVSQEIENDRIAYVKSQMPFSQDEAQKRINEFLILKLAQLANENKELKRRIEILCGNI